MRILMLSRDAKIFKKGSAVRARMVEYGTLFEELHVVVLNKKAKSKNKNDIVKIKNTTIYPTNSRTKFFYLWDAYGLCKKILNTKYEIRNTEWIITSQDPFETGLAALMVSRKLNIPLQLQIHSDFLSSYFKKESIKNRIRVLIAKQILKEASCIRVVSTRIKNSLSNVKCQMSNVSILPIWIDTQKIKAVQQATLPKKFDFTILWVGRLEKEKNPLLAVRAFYEILQKIPNAGLIIVGDGSLRERLELQATSYKLQANILFTGWKDNIAGYYKSADVLLVTSWHEGYGMNMVEARIADIPVVAPDVGVAREIGAYITKYTPDSIAEMLARLYKKELPQPAEYEYPYKNKEQYLELYKKSFETCSPGDKKT